VHIQPLLRDSNIPWRDINKPQFHPQFYKHVNTFHLYKLDNNVLSLFKIQGGAKSKLRALYTNVPYMTDLPFNSVDFYAVDTHITPKGIQIVGDWYNQCPTQIKSETQSLDSAFRSLHPALRETCGTIQFPPDNGYALMDGVHSSGSLFGASDASFKNGKAAHAWIISSGKVDDISNPLLNISET
jgi:hypothetical protein